MTKQIAFLLLLMCYVTNLFSQTPDKKEIRLLYEKIELYLHAQEKLDGSKRTSEYLILTFDVDSSGSIHEMHILADDQNRDTIYYQLRRMPIAILKSWKSEKCKEKTIILPVLCTDSKSNQAYIKRLQKISRHKKTEPLMEAGDVIVLNSLELYTPRRSH